MITALLVCLAFAPTTSPANQPTTKPAYQSGIPKIMADLRAQIAELQFQIKAVQIDNRRLRIENEALKKELAEMKGPPPAIDAKIAEGIKSHEIIVGMTVEQVTESLGKGWNKPVRVSEEEGSVIYSWKLWGLGTARSRSPLIEEVIATFRDGKLIRYDRLRD